MPFSIISNEISLFPSIIKNSSSHYQIMNALNHWYVITGAPCSGKTSVIREIEKRGYGTVPEAARTYIKQELAQGLTLDKIKENKPWYHFRLDWEDEYVKKHDTLLSKLKD